MGSGKLGLSKSVIRVLINLVLHVGFFAQLKERKFPKYFHFIKFKFKIKKQ